MVDPKKDDQQKGGENQMIYTVSKVEAMPDGRYKVTAKDTDPEKQKHQNVSEITDDPKKYHVGMKVVVRFADAD
jgi:hypothetical protein